MRHLYVRNAQKARHVEMRIGTHTGRAIVEFRASAANMIHELFQTRRNHPRTYRVNVRQLDQIRHACQIARGLDAECLPKSRFVNRIGRYVADEQCVAVGRCTRRYLQSNVARYPPFPRAVPGEARLVVVTRGPEAESPGLLRDIAPPDVPVVLSTEAWEAYDVPVAPYFTLVEGATGRIVGEGAGTSWAQVTSLLTQALGDAPQPRPARRTPSTDRAREARADEELLSAGIGPGDPRLYPTQLDAEGGQDSPQ